MSEKFILLLLCILGLLSIWPLIMGFYLIPLIVLEGVYLMVLSLQIFGGLCILLAFVAPNFF